MDLSLIIPAHNEEDRLATTLASYAQALHSRHADAFEIIVVANNCVDNTVSVALHAASAWPQIRVLDVKAAIGKGGAILAGFHEAHGRAVLFADADAATAPASLLTLADALARHDIVIGSRRLPGSVITEPQPLPRRAAGRAFAVAIRTLFRMPYRDTQCGAKAFRRAAVEQLAPLIQEKRWAFDVDLLLTARELGLTVEESPITWGDRPGSRLRFLPTLREVGASLWRLRRRHGARRPAMSPEPLYQREHTNV